MAKNILDTLYQASIAPIDESEVLHVGDLCNMAPNLHDFMRFEYWQGEPVDPPKLTFQVQGGALWVGISDVERQRSCRFECDGIERGISFIESLITSGELSRHFRDWPSKSKTAKKLPKRSSNGHHSKTTSSRQTSSRKRSATKA